MLLKPTDCRFHTRCVPLSFKQRLACAVQHHETLRTREIAERARVQHATLLDYCQDGRRDIPFEALLRVVHVTGRIDLFAIPIHEALGFVVAPAPASDAHAASVSAETLDVAAATGTLAERVRAALEGGVNERERSEILEAVHATREQLGELEASLGTPAASSIERLSMVPRPTPAKALRRSDAASECGA